MKGPGFLLSVLALLSGCVALRAYAPDAERCAAGAVAAQVEPTSPHTVRVSLRTSAPGPLTLRWGPAVAGAPRRERAVTVQEAMVVPLEDLQACTPYTLEVTHGPGGSCHSTVSFETGDVPWPDRCGESRGEVLDPVFAQPSRWATFTHDGAPASVQALPDLCTRPPGREVPGLALRYHLGPCNRSMDGVRCAQDWAVAARAYAASPFTATPAPGTALRVVVGGSEGRSDDPPDLEVSLVTEHRGGRCKFLNRIPGAVTGAPTTHHLPLCEFRYRFDDDPLGCEAAGLDLARVVAIEVGVARRYHRGMSLGTHDGTLSVEDLRLVPLAAPEYVHAPEVLVPDPAVLAAIGQSLLATQGEHSHGLLRSWREDTDREFIVYHTYNQALALMVLTREASRVADSALRGRYQAAADRLAQRLLDLPRHGGAAWFDCYREARAAPGALQACPFPPEVTAPWPGNSSWVLLGLHAYRRDSGVVPPSIMARIASSMEYAAMYLEGLQSTVEGAPGCVHQGTEASVSAYLGLRAAGHREAAERVRRCLFAPAPEDCSARHWDAREGRFWAARVPRWRGPDPRREGRVVLHPAGDASYALDLLCGWGARLLALSGAPPEALALSLGVARTIFAARSQDGLVEGLCDIASPCHGPTTEFGAMAAASGVRDGMCILRRIERGLRVSPGEYRASREPFEGGRPGAWAEVWTGLPTQCWVYLAHAGDRFETL